MIRNALTGEAVIGGVEVIFTIEAWLIVESELNLTATELVERMQRGCVGFRDVVCLLMAGHEAWRRREAPTQPSLRPEDASAALMRAGGLLAALADLSHSILMSGTIVPRPDADGGSPPLV